MKHECVSVFIFSDNDLLKKKIKVKSKKIPQ